MPHVVTGRCVSCRYTDCCVVCPVEAFHEVDDPPMLVIDPNACIDCEQCVQECPINAIYPDTELPAPYAAWKEKNAELCTKTPTISAKKEPLPTRKTLAEIQAEEKAKGWQIEEPSKAG